MAESFNSIFESKDNSGAYFTKILPSISSLVIKLANEALVLALEPIMGLSLFQRSLFDCLPVTINKMIMLGSHLHSTFPYSCCPSVENIVVLV